MNELSPLRLWLMRASFAALAMMVIFFQLLPLNTAPIDLFTPDLIPLTKESEVDARLAELLREQEPSRWVAPNVMLGFAMAWAMRRPEYLPAAMLAILFLLADLLLQRPPGLWAAVALLGVERLKSRGRTLRDSTFPAEWFVVAMVLVAIMLGERLVLAVTLVPVPPLGLSLFELGMTIIFYPIFAAITHWIMGVRKLAPGELDASGYRL